MDPSDTGGQGRRRRGGPLLALLLLGGAALLAFRSGDLRAVSDALRGADPRWLGAAVALQPLAFALNGLSLRLLLRPFGASRSLGSLTRRALEMQFVNVSVPSAATSGRLYLAGALVRAGVPGGTVVAVTEVELVATNVASAAWFVTVLAAVASGAAPGVVTGVLAAAAVVSLAAAIATAAVARMPGLLTGVLSGMGRVARRVRLPVPAETGLRPERIAEAMSQLLARRPTLLATVGIEAAVVGVEVAVLTCVLAGFGAGWTPGTAAAAGVAGHAGFLLTPLPGGVVGAEAAIVAVLAAGGVGYEVALLSALAFRALAFWVPVPLGWLSLAARVARRG